MLYQNYSAEQAKGFCMGTLDITKINQKAIDKPVIHFVQGHFLTIHEVLSLDKPELENKKAHHNIYYLLPNFVN